MANLELKTASGGSVTLVPENGVSNTQAVIPQSVGELYGKGNVLGTVSESGGVPTGAIIQRGSNANGEFVRYADGTQISWIHNHNGGELANIPSGNVFMTEFQSYTFPVEFSQTPAVSITSRGSSTWSGNCRSANPSGVSNYLQFSSTSNSSTVEARIIAIGHWF